MEINQDNICRIKEELDDVIYDCKEAPYHLLVECVLFTLDNAEKEGRLNSKERKIACNYITNQYGYDF